MGHDVDDIRLATSWRGHRKRKKLKRMLGADGVLALMDLWIGAAISRPDGVLHGFSIDDIALEADWGGEPQAFVDALIDCGFLERDESGTFTLHDWQDYQGWVMSKESRVAKAKKGAAARWGKPSDAPSMPEACSKHARSNAPLHSSPLHTERQTITPHKDDMTARDDSPSPRPEESGGGAGEKPGSAPYESEPYAVSLEIQQIGEGYPEHRYDPGAADNELKKLAAKRQWPGLPRVLDDIARRSKCEDWTREDGRFVPTLSRYIRDRTWLTKIPEARAAPPSASYASPESRAVDEIAETLRRKEAAKHERNELPENHQSERAGGFAALGAALPEVEAGRSPRPPGP